MAPYFNYREANAFFKTIQDTFTSELHFCPKTTFGRKCSQKQLLSNWLAEKKVLATLCRILVSGCVSDNRAPFSLQGYNINFLDDSGDGKLPKLNLMDVMDFFTRGQQGAPDDDDGDSSIGISGGASFDAETSFQWFMNSSPSTSPTTSPPPSPSTGQAGNTSGSSGSSTASSSAPSCKLCCNMMSQHSI